MNAKPVKVLPIGDQVLIQLLAPEQQTDGGLTIPGEAQQQRPMGKVLDIGDDVEGVEIGDYILFRGPYVLSAVEVWHNGSYIEQCLLGKRDVVAVVVMAGVDEEIIDA